MRKYLGICLFLVYIFPMAATAEIDKLTVPSNTGFTLYWWPVLPVIPGWHHDENASEAQAANIIVPDGQNFSNAPAIIYGKADYKPRLQGVNSVDQFIDNDERQFAQGTQIAELAPIRDGDGQVLRCFSFTPRGNGSWEIVAYGHEGDYFLIFVVSAFTRTGLQGAEHAFETLVRNYKAKL